VANPNKNWVWQHAMEARDAKPKSDKSIKNGFMMMHQ